MIVVVGYAAAALIAFLVFLWWLIGEDIKDPEFQIELEEAMAERKRQEEWKRKVGKK